MKPNNQPNTNKNDGPKDKIGGFWKHEFTSASGQKENYLSGMIEIDGKKIEVVLFKNNGKAKALSDGDKPNAKNWPDYELLLSRKQKDKNSSNENPDIL